MPGTRKIHSNKTTGSDLKLATRNASCYCVSCRTPSSTLRCNNEEYVEEWSSGQIKLVKPHSRRRLVVQEAATTDHEVLKQYALKWGKFFRQVTFDEHVTPYIHTMVYHLPHFLGKYKYLNDLSCESVEQAFPRVTSRGKSLQLQGAYNFAYHDAVAEFAEDSSRQDRSRTSLELSPRRATTGNAVCKLEIETYAGAGDDCGRGFNNSILQYHDKRIVFGRDQYLMRSHLDWNEHVDREPSGDICNNPQGNGGASRKANSFKATICVKYMFQIFAAENE
ncbi:hypothetical protein Bbelb_344190 [Branchiostoma belcheri]|nr:hypothetical protein Bbelb_344190 [Branchiostoma belcheri]